MTCAKRIVRCYIHHPTEGLVGVGENICKRPQQYCPREDGEDYTKCKTICQQYGHAEVMALEMAKELAQSSTAVIDGHHYVCEHCDAAMTMAGIAKVEFTERRLRT